MKRKVWRWVFYGAVLLGLAAGLAACGSPAPEPEAQPSETPAEEAAAAPATTSPVPEQVPTQTPAPAAAATPTAAPTEVAWPETPITGIEMHKIDPSGGLELVAESGVHWVRRNALEWSQVEPQPGDRNWEAQAELEAELVNAAEQGLEMLLIVRDTPTWAQQIPGVSCGPVAEERLADFAGFLHDAVARYSQAPYNVKYWELINEPDIASGMVEPDNFFGCWGDADDPYYGGGAYAGMLKAVYPEVKAADPQARVLVGGLLMDCDPNNPPEVQPGSGEYKDCSPSRYLEGILENGGGDFFDGVSFHAYDFYGNRPGFYGNYNWQSRSDTSGPVLINKTRYLRSLLAAHNVPDKFLVNSESGLLCLGEAEACKAEDFENTKAYYAAEANAAALTEGLRANIWYSITGWRSSGLMTRQREPLPAFGALAYSAAQLEAARPLGPVYEYPDVMGYAFERRDGSRMWLVWSRSGEPVSIQLSDAPTRVSDVFGEELPAAAELTVEAAPVYLEWQP